MLWIEPKKKRRNKNAWLYDRSYQREGMIPTLICYAGNKAAAAAAVIVGP